MLSELSKTCVCCMREGKPEVVPFVRVRPSWPNRPDRTWDADLVWDCSHSVSGKGVACLPTESEAMDSLRRMYPQIDA